MRGTSGTGVGLPRVMPVARCTISAATPAFTGPGIFSGAPATIIIRPSHAATGILFTSPGRGPVAATIGRVVDWKPAKWPTGMGVRNTSIGMGAWSVGTVEHVMSVLAGLGITDAVIEVDGPEVPILDGSAEPFVRALLPLAARVDRTVEPIVLRSVVEVTDGGGGRVRATPRDEPGCSYRYELDYGAESSLKPQAAVWTGGSAAYAAMVAPARTFSMWAEAEAARAAGLFKGFSTREMLVVGDDGEPLDNTWRMPDEPAHHKLLDLIGDVALLGRPVQMDIVAHKSGHRLVQEWCRAVMRHVAG